MSWTGVKQLITDAATGHPERMASLSEAVAIASEGLEVVLAMASGDAAKGHGLTQRLGVEASRLAELQQQLAELQARELAEGTGRRGLVRRSQELQAVAEAAQSAQDERAGLLAQNGLLARRLNNEILGLKGNFRVFCRLRPQRPRSDEESKETLKVDMQEDRQGLTVFAAPQRNVTGMSEHTSSWDFEFDHVFRPNAPQAIVFEEIALLVQSALDGYRVAIFAYGQTGSGKTHTMGGSGLDAKEDEHAGMIPRSVDLIFREVEQLQQTGWSFEVHASMAEVYNEAVLDLLASRQHSQNSASSTSDSSSTEASFAMSSERERSEAKFVSGDPQLGFRRVPVKDASAVHALLRRAHRERHVAATTANERSSRSHVVFQLSLIGRCEVPGQQREVSGLLSFVDLAGSERLHSTGASGERLKEAQHINRSLGALGDVIEAIGRKSSCRGSASALAVHVPYRNSRLTMLLRDSLGGDSKTLFFVNVSPLLEHLGETLSSLRFASKANGSFSSNRRLHMPRLVSSPIGGARLLCFGATPCAGSRRRHCARPRGTLKSSRYRGKGGGSREEGHERCKSERCVCSESGRRSVTLKSFAGNPQAFITECADQCLQDQGEGIQAGEWPEELSPESESETSRRMADSKPSPRATITVPSAGATAGGGGGARSFGSWSAPPPPSPRSANGAVSSGSSSRKVSTKFTLGEGDNEIFCVRFSPDDLYLAAACGDGSINVYNTATGKRAFLLNSGSENGLPTTQVRWRPQQSLSKTKNVLVSVGADGRVLHWHASSGKCLHEIVEPDNQLFCIDYFADGSQFATAGKKREIRIYDEYTKKLSQVLRGGDSINTPGHSNRVFSLKYHPTTRNLLVTG
ncbi:unnamed protein product, partial [Polarella glacialis]